MYKYDLKKYSELLNIIYLPSLEMERFIPKSLQDRIKELGPGSDNRNLKENEYGKNIIYVGGFGEFYNIKNSLLAINQVKNFKLTISTRKAEWENEKEKFSNLDFDNIRVKFLEGEGLKEEYLKSNFGLLMLNPHPYLDFAVPYKLYEYASYNLPIIASRGTLSGTIVEENNIGFTIENKIEDIKEFLLSLDSRKEEIKIIKDNLKKFTDNNSWKSRALQVAKDLGD